LEYTKTSESEDERVVMYLELSNSILRIQQRFR
jgi:hypothetical protein